ncbi:MAG: cache domain-containing protein [Desulfuromonadales bacterium]|nr:cache domain-containing protein [Desulfuromonadales bacterium]
MNLKILNNLPIRYKFIIACTMLFTPLAIMVGFFSDSLMRDTLEVQIRRELKNSTESILNMIKLSAQLSIKNSLRNIAENNTDIVRMYHQQYLDGVLTEKEAKAQAAKILLSQQIASSGYIYCLDSNGVVVVHPVDAMVGQNLTGISFVDDQVKRKSGYQEYAWRNPDDLKAKPKAAWMTHFEPWDWIISVSAYREEFDHVVDIDDFRESIGSLEFMKSGYSYVIDLNGTLIAHPTYQGKNVYAQGVETPEGLFATMLTQDSGEVFYTWQNPTEMSPRRKIVVFNRIQEMGWVVASSAYLDDLYRPLDTIRNIGLLIGLFILCGGILVAMQISTAITRPMELLIDHLAHGATGDYSVRMNYQGRDEIGQLSSFFNQFMERLGAAIHEREKLEQQFIEADDKERLRAGQDLHDDLAPHLIGVEIMCQTLAKRLREDSSPAAEQAETIRGLLADATRKTRALARGLCPIHRVDEGLGFALQELIDTVMTFYPVQCQTYGTNCTPIDRAVAVHIYRITQEAIYNAVKHANPNIVTVTLSQDDDALIVEITDDGTGLPDSETSANGEPSNGMGRQIMAFRARMIKADLEVVSSPKSGTTVRLFLPNKYINKEDALNA